VLVSLLYYLYSFGRQNEAKLQVFAVPMAAKRGSWDNFPCVPQAALWGPFCSISPFLLGDALSAPVHVWQSLLHAFCVWLLAFGDTMLEPEHFQFVWSFFSNYRSFLFTWYVCCFSLPSLGRGRGLDQGCDELRLAHGLSFPCMAFLEQDQWHIISLSSQTCKQVTCSLQIQKQAQQGYDLPKST